MFDNHTIQQIKDMKKAGFTASQIFTLSYQYCGQPQRMWTIYYGARIITSDTSKSVALSIRNELFTNPENIIRYA